MWPKGIFGEFRSFCCEVLFTHSICWKHVVETYGIANCALVKISFLEKCLGPRSVTRPNI
jgi:hypothetical protein